MDAHGCVTGSQQAQSGSSARAGSEIFLVTAVSLLSASILLQLAAAVIAIRLIKITGSVSAWPFVASALALMCVRRSITLFYLLTEDNDQVVNLPAELMALIISILLFASMILFRSHFSSQVRRASALQESESMYRGILENLIDTYFRANKAGRLTMVSPSVVDLLGYSHEELIGRPLFELFAHEKERKELLEVLNQQGRVHAFRAFLTAKNGDNILVETNAYFVASDRNNQARVEGICRKVS